MRIDGNGGTIHGDVRRLQKPQQVTRRFRIRYREGLSRPVEPDYATQQTCDPPRLQFEQGGKYGIRMPALPGKNTIHGT